LAHLRHVPMRRCSVCRRQLVKAELTRWTIVDGLAVRDELKAAPGRGYYTCSEECEKRWQKRH
jgi:predicted RNA-binding protein YlxR (DUF448 family)